MAQRIRNGAAGPGWVTAAVAGTLRADEPMSRHTSWRVGGAADWFYVPAGRADLAAFLQALPEDVALLWVGLGSNLLVRDGGFRGVVIATHKGLGGIALADARTVRAEAGVAAAKVARFAVRMGLEGAEFLAGIPGTLGGALAMNAGAFGGETWDIVSSVETVDRHGRLRRRLAGDIETGYRTVQLPAGEWFVAADLALTPGSPQAGKARVRALLATRGHSQPIQAASAGSVFRNPAGDHAARLIESAGLKGLSEGDAVVSSQHANFIINRGKATAADIECLIRRVRLRVRAVHGVQLEPEVHIVGD